MRHIPTEPPAPPPAPADGGPAFPQHVAPAYRQEPAIWGMSLRDYFAGQALMGLIAGREFSDWDDVEEAVAMIAYAYADCMLERRQG